MSMPGGQVKVKLEKPDPADLPSLSSSSSSGGGNDVDAFSKRIIELFQQFPDGISDKIVGSEMPHITANQRADAINKLMDKGVLELYKSKGGDLVYKQKTAVPEQLKGADKEEIVVYNIIKESGNKGIWIRDIRVKSGLSATLLGKITKIFENKRIIKSVKSVAATRKKVFMLYELEPDRSVTGGSWYSDQDYDSTFVTILNQQCYRYLTERRQKAQLESPLFGYRQRRQMALATVEEVTAHIAKLNLCKVTLSPEDVSEILNTLIYDEKVQKIQKGDDTFYVAVDALHETCGLIQVPCGVCPVAQHCSERGSVNPISCIYIPQWLGTEF